MQLICVHTLLCTRMKLANQFHLTDSAQYSMSAGVEEQFALSRMSHSCVVTIDHCVFSELLIGAFREALLPASSKSIFALHYQIVHNHQKLGSV